MSGVVGVTGSRAWPVGPELAWYLVVLAYALVGRAGAVPPDRRVEYGVVIALTLLCVAGALARWWAPAWTGRIVLAVLGVAVAFVVLRFTGVAWPLWPVRLTVSGAIQPVLLAAAVRRCGAWITLPALALAILAVRLSVDGVSFVRELLLGVVGSDPSRPLLVITSLLLITVPLALGLLLRSTDAGRAAERAARLRAEERLRVARELHDTVANHVTGIILRAQATTLDAGLSPGTRQGIDAIEEAGNRALGAMRGMVDALRADASAAPAVTDEASETSPAAVVGSAIDDGSGVRLRVDDALRTEDGAPPELTPAVAGALHHVAVEALTNARRHRTPGSRIDVVLDVPRPGVVALEVSNDVGPVPVVLGGGWGLVGLRERVEAVGGQLHAGPLEPARWRLRVELPHASTCAAAAPSALRPRRD